MRAGTASGPRALLPSQRPRRGHSLGGSRRAGPCRRGRRGQVRVREDRGVAGAEPAWSEVAGGAQGGEDLGVIGAIGGRHNRDVAVVLGCSWSVVVVLGCSRSGGAGACSVRVERRRSGWRRGITRGGDDTLRADGGGRGGDRGGDDRGGDRGRGSRGCASRCGCRGVRCAARAAVTRRCSSSGPRSPHGGVAGGGGVRGGGRGRVAAGRRAVRAGGAAGAAGRGGAGAGAVGDGVFGLHAGGVARARGGGAAARRRRTCWSTGASRRGCAARGGASSARTTRGCTSSAIATRRTIRGCTGATTSSCACAAARSRSTAGRCWGRARGWGEACGSSVDEGHALEVLDVLSAVGRSASCRSSRSRSRGRSSWSWRGGGSRRAACGRWRCRGGVSGWCCARVDGCAGGSGTRPAARGFACASRWRASSCGCRRRSGWPR